MTNSNPVPSNAAFLTGKYCTHPDNEVCKTDDVDFYDDSGWTFIQELRKNGY